MSKHTPGPWGISRICSTVVHAGEKERGIATTGGHQDNSVDAEELLAENEANARLIAAAPDLLDELERAIGELEKAAQYVGQRDLGAAMAMACNNIERRKLVAKAKGEA